MDVNTKILILLYLRKRKLNETNERCYTKRKCWVRRFYEEREVKGEFNMMVKDLRLVDHELFGRYFRMTPQKYENLLNLVAPFLIKESKFRKPISPDERLSVTLRYLVTGDLQTTIALCYRMSPTTVGRIVNETCEVIWNQLLENKYIDAPSCSHDWKKIADGFEKRWNFPNCIGAIDGKHVVMQAPPRSGSLFYNYKGSHSIVLMAVVNANYQFSFVDIGDLGGQSDGGVFSSCNFGISFNNDTLNIPEPSNIKDTNELFPYVLVGDEAFPLKINLLKPYPKSSLGIKERVFNYRLSRARRMVENVFGICATRFRIFRRPIIANVEMVVRVTKAVVALHNFLMADKDFLSNDYCSESYADREQNNVIISGEWRREEPSQGLINIQHAGSNNFTQIAKNVRDKYRDYFSSNTGSVDWQWDMI